MIDLPRHIRIFTLLAGWLVGISTIFAQSNTPDREAIQEELKTLAQNYKQGQYSFTVSYNYYSNAEQKSPDRVLNGFVKMNGDQFHYRIGENEVIKDNQYIVVLDHQSKTVMVDTVISESPNAVDDLLLSDELIEKSLANLERRVTNGRIIYGIPNPQPGIKYQVVTVVKEGLYMERLAMYFYENRPGKDLSQTRNKLIVDFKEVNFSPTYVSGYFNTNKIVKRNGSSFTLSAAYKEYSLFENE